MSYERKHFLILKTAVVAGCLAIFAQNVSAQDVLDGETVEDQTVANDTLNINSGGTANNTTINDAGVVNVYKDGTANTVTVNEGGTLIAEEAGAKADDVTINAGGSFGFSTDATVTDITFAGEGGEETTTGSIENKTANNIVIGADSYLIVNGEGTANNTIVNREGVLGIDEKGTANNTTVNAGGSISATGDSTLTDLTINKDASFEFSTNATITDATINDQAVSIEEHKAKDFIVNADSSLVVEGGGSADNTKVEGGYLEVTGDGSSATNTTISDGGEMNITDQATADTVTVNGSGSIEVSGGGSISNATLTGTDDKNKATITVDGSTANNTVLNNNSEMTVTNGGKTTATTVGDKASLDVNNGTAEDTTVNSGGTIIATEKGSTVSGVTIKEGGKFDFSTDATVTDIKDAQGQPIGSISGNKATDITIGDGSQLTVKDGGSASNITVNSGGSISSSGTNSSINGLTIGTGGTFNLSTETEVSDMKDSEGNSLGSITDNKASDVKVGAGSTLTVEGNQSSAENTMVDGGTLVVNGGTATGGQIMNGGTIVAKEEGSLVEGTVIDENSKFDFSTNASVNATQGDQTITIADKRGELFTVKNGSKFSVDDGGSSYRIVVSNGGEMEVNEGGEAVWTNVAGGVLNVNGGNVSTLNVGYGGVVNATSGIIAPGESVSEEHVPQVKILQDGTLNISDAAQTFGVQVEGGSMNVSGGAANETTVSDGGQMNVSGGTVSNTTVNKDGNMDISGGTVSVVTVNEGGTLETSGTVAVSDLNAGSGSTIKLGADTSLEGSLTMDAKADVSGSALDFSNLFTADNDKLSSLTLTGGVNDAFKGQLVNKSSEDKTLTLAAGKYTIFNPAGSEQAQEGAVQVNGWNTVNISSSSTVRLESDMTMSGSEKNLIIESGAQLDVSGVLGNVLDITLDGNVQNSGTIDFNLSGSEIAGDKLSITGNYTADNALLIMDVNPRDNIADNLYIGGDVSGNTSIYLKSNSAALPDGNILIVDAPNDDAETASSFSVWRYEGSPYTWETLFENNKWYAYVIDGDRPGIVPETAAYYGLIDNTFMQTASLGTNLRTNVVENEFRKVPCRTAGDSKYSNKICRSGRPVFTGWAAPVYSEAKVKSPYNYTASVTGFDGGLDLISDGNTKFGIMASYRNGTYTYDEDGENYTLKGEAETSINSYLGGAYIRFDGGAWSTIGAVYAGKLDVDVSSEDGVSGDTSGTTWGATLDVSYIYENITGFRIEPGVRISYTSVSLDEFEDNAGKRQEFEDADRKEIEAGIKLAQRWDFPDSKAEIYVKPSIVQTMDSTNDFELIEERVMDAAEDRTLAKVEAGMSFDMINNWSAAVKASYAFGSDYENTTAAVNILYNF